MSILDQYVKSAPSAQNALDIFKGEWASRLPGPLAQLRAGSIPLFEDPRIEWGVGELGGVKNKTVLEVGPLEAGHTYMLEHLGAASITSIEANTRAYLKCLIVKELLGLKRAHFQCGDIIEYLHTNQSKFDVCFASGVLYHMHNPVELLALLAKTSDRLFVWTHYYDATIVSENPNLAHKFTSHVSATYDGFRHVLYRMEYKEALDYVGFCGGSSSYSHWMTYEDILACLSYFGFHDIRIGFQDPKHANGPCFAFAAIRGRKMSCPELLRRVRRLVEGLGSSARPAACARCLGESG